MSVSLWRDQMGHVFYCHSRLAVNLGNNLIKNTLDPRLREDDNEWQQAKPIQFYLSLN
jgi:hypothetical protein